MTLLLWVSCRHVPAFPPVGGPGSAGGARGKPGHDCERRRQWLLTRLHSPFRLRDRGPVHATCSTFRSDRPRVSWVCHSLRGRSVEQTSELLSLLRISFAVFSLSSPILPL